MKDWRVKDGHIEISAEERNKRIKALLDEYVQIAKKLPQRTPKEILDILQLNYMDWFRSVDPDVVDDFVNQLDKRLIKMDFDPYWDVSLDFQMKAGEVFNVFIKAMNKAKPKRKKDRLAVSRVMNEAFGTIFGIHPDDRSLTRAIAGNKQLNRVAQRLVKRLEKMGYAF
jgi:vacuolar-type H+-ATPase subunit E/Vma4